MHNMRLDAESLPNQMLIWKSPTACCALDQHQIGSTRRGRKQVWCFLNRVCVIKKTKDFDSPTTCISPALCDYTTLKPCEITENAAGRWDLVARKVRKWIHLRTTGSWVYWLVEEWKPVLGRRRLLGSKDTVNNNPSREGHFSSLAHHKMTWHAVVDLSLDPMWKASRRKKAVWSVWFVCLCTCACVCRLINEQLNTQGNAEQSQYEGDFLLPSACWDTLQQARQANIKK